MGHDLNVGLERVRDYTRSSVAYGVNSLTDRALQLGRLDLNQRSPG